MNVWTTLGDGIDALQRTDRPLPMIKPDHILVKMTAASLNFRDLLVVKGVEHWKPSTPRIPISDGVGEVVAVGDQVTRWQVGDHVAGIFLPRWLDGELTAEQYVAPLGGAAVDGVLADYTSFHEQAVVKTPDNLSDLEAATLPVAALTAWHAVMQRCRVQRGDRVLIYGTGGVALFATQFVHALGGHPIVTSSSDAKLERAKALTAATTINRTTVPDWEAHVLELTDGRGVDHVLEVVGGDHLNRSLNVVKVTGTIAFIGLLAGLSAPINTYQFVTKNVQLHGIETGSRAMFEEMNHFIEAHHIQPVIDTIFAVDSVGQALRHLESGAHLGKIVVTFA